MENYNSFNFSIKVETHTENLEDLNIAMAEACSALDFQYKTSERVYKEANTLANEKFNLIMKQVAPLMEACATFREKHKEHFHKNCISICISRPSLEWKGSYDFYKVWVQEGIRNSDYILIIDTEPSDQKGRPYIEVNSIVSKKSAESWGNFLLKKDNPFSCWEEWGVFDKLKEEVIRMLKKETQENLESIKKLLDFEKNLGVHN